MSELVLIALKVGFLALLWLFIYFTGNVIRTDLFGRKVTATELADARAAQLKSPRKTRASRKLPTRLRVTKGRQEGLTLELGEGIKIGRASDCQLILDDDYVSTRHARLYRSGDAFLVEDLGSTNGTYVNDQRITVPTPFTLKDTLRIGHTLMTVEK